LHFLLGHAPLAFFARPPYIFWSAALQFFLAPLTFFGRPPYTFCSATLHFFARPPCIFLLGHLAFFARPPYIFRPMAERSRPYFPTGPVSAALPHNGPFGGD
jgi:hypothetical protein